MRNIELVSNGTDLLVFTFGPEGLLSFMFEKFLCFDTPDVNE